VPYPRYWKHSVSDKNFESRSSCILCFNRMKYKTIASLHIDFITRNGDRLTAMISSCVYLISFYFFIEWLYQTVSDKFHEEFLKRYACLEISAFARLNLDDFEFWKVWRWRGFSFTSSLCTSCIEAIIVALRRRFHLIEKIVSQSNAIDSDNLREGLSRAFFRRH